MRTLFEQDPISGKEGCAYAKINGNNEELFYAKSIELTIENNKSDINAIGKRMTGHKVTGQSRTGSMTIYYITPIFRSMMIEYKRTGKMPYFDLVVENNDPASSAKKQSALAVNCCLDSVILAKLDGDSDDALDEDVDFTFEDYDILTPFTKF